MILRDALQRPAVEASSLGWRFRIFEGDQPLVEWHEDSTTEYTPGHGAHAVHVNHGGHDQWIVRDAVATLRVISDSRARILHMPDFTAFGGSSSASPPYSLASFAGLKPLSTFPFLDALTRTYRPDVGRWIQPDPAGEVDGLNPYLYVANNPLTRRDPLGLAAVDAEADAYNWLPAVPLEPLEPDLRLALWIGEELGTPLAVADEFAGSAPAILGLVKRAGDPVLRHSWIGQQNQLADLRSLKLGGVAILGGLLTYAGQAAFERGHQTLGLSLESLGVGVGSATTVLAVSAAAGAGLGLFGASVLGIGVFLSGWSFGSFVDRYDPWLLPFIRHEVEATILDQEQERIATYQAHVARQVRGTLIRSAEIELVAVVPRGPSGMPR